MTNTAESFADNEASSGVRLTRPQFTCHEVDDGHIWNGKTIGWALAGEGRVYISGWLETTKAKVRADFPNADFVEDGFHIYAGEESVLLAGAEGYLRWVREGRPPYVLSADGQVTW